MSPFYNNPNVDLCDHSSTVNPAAAVGAGAGVPDH